MNQIKMLLLVLCAALGLCSCQSSNPYYSTTSAGGYGYEGGDYGRPRERWQPDPNRPKGVLKTTTESGVDRQHHKVHFEIGADIPRNLQPVLQPRLRAINDQLGNWYGQQHMSTGTPPTQAEVESKAQQLIAAEPMFAHLHFTRETNKQGCWGVTFMPTTGNKERIVNPTTTTTTDVIDETKVPTEAKRQPAVRGPEQFQPPAGYRKSASPPLTQTSDTTPSGGFEPELPQ